MATYKVWFDHHEGPYCVLGKADSLRELEESHAGDPFFICVEPEDSTLVPCGSLYVQAISAAAFGIDLFLDGEV